MTAPAALASRASPALEAEFQLALRDGAHRFRRAFALRHGAGVLALVGPSGCGKTLALRAIAGLLRPASGSVALAGRVVEDVAASVHVPPEARFVGYVPQDAKLFPHLTVEENVRFGERDDGRRRWSVDQCVALLGLGALVGRRPAGLSGGERQRVALARALASAPELLLLDEPFSALDVRARSELRGRLRDVLAETALPAVLVSHDADEVAALAQAVVEIG